MKPKIKLQTNGGHPPAPVELLDELLDEELGMMGTPPPPPPPTNKIKLKPIITSEDKPSNGLAAPATTGTKKLKLKPVSNGTSPVPDRPLSTNVYHSPSAPPVNPVQTSAPMSTPHPLPLAVNEPNGLFRKPEPPIANVSVSQVQTLINPRRARTIFEHLMKFPAAFIASLCFNLARPPVSQIDHPLFLSMQFLRPVDPIQDGCPTYYDEIKEPMDFGTMQNKLSTGQYHTWGAFGADMELVFRK